MGKIPEIPKEVRENNAQLVEKVSATILQGLFEIPELQCLEKGDFAPEKVATTLDRGQTKIDKIFH